MSYLPKVCREQVYQHTEHKTDGKGGERFENAREHQILGGVLHEVQAHGHHAGEAQTENWKKNKLVSLL